MRFRPVFAGAFGSTVAALAAGIAACSNSAGNAPIPTAEAGADTSVGPVGPNESKQKGTVMDAIDKFPVVGATVTVGGKTAVTGADGTYEIVVPRNAAYSMAVAQDEHYKLNEQEWIVKSTTFDRGVTALLSKDIANLLLSFLPPRDSAKGLLVVRIYPQAPCDSEQGSLLSIEPKGASKVTYFAGGKPSTAATSTTKDEAFSAVFSDVDVGIPIKVTVDSPSCEQVPFPIDDKNITYTGVQKTEAGAVLSYIRVTIGPKKAADAATD